MNLQDQGFRFCVHPDGLSRWMQPEQAEQLAKDGWRDMTDASDDELASFTRQNLDMPKPNEPKRPPGRPEVQPEDRLQVVSIRLTEAQKAKLDRLGGSAWLREKINRAKEPGRSGTGGERSP